MTDVRVNRIWIWLVAAVVVACSQGSVKKAPKRCTEFGQKCEFAPGKLGACVVREGCEGPDCLVCQSQH